MVSYKKRGSKTQKRRRSKKGGDGEDDEWDIEMGATPKVEAARAREIEQRAIADKDADDMENGLTKFSPEPDNSGPEHLGGKRRRGNKSKKHHKKGSMSKTHKGRKDFHRHNHSHRQSKRQGKKPKSLLARIFGL